MVQSFAMHEQIPPHELLVADSYYTGPTDLSVASGQFIDLFASQVGAPLVRNAVITANVHGADFRPDPPETQGVFLKVVEDYRLEAAGSQPSSELDREIFDQEAADVLKPQIDTHLNPLVIVENKGNSFELRRSVSYYDQHPGRFLTGIAGSALLREFLPDDVLYRKNNIQPGTIPATPAGVRRRVVSIQRFKLWE